MKTLIFWIIAILFVQWLTSCSRYCRPERMVGYNQHWQRR